MGGDEIDSFVHVLRIFGARDPHEAHARRVCSCVRIQLLSRYFHKSRSSTLLCVLCVSTLNGFPPSIGITRSPNVRPDTSS